MLLSLRNGGKPVNNVRTKVTTATKNFQKKSFEVVEIQWINDSGAGRVVRSSRALKDQGIDPKMWEKILSRPTQPIVFDTGGGEQHASDS
eukprot:10949287-Karenia_brevis.AAC.1